MCKKYKVLILWKWYFIFFFIYLYLTCSTLSCIRRIGCTFCAAVTRCNPRRPFCFVRVWKVLPFNTRDLKTPALFLEGLDDVFHLLVVINELWCIYFFLLVTFHWWTDARYCFICFSWGGGLLTAPLITHMIWNKPSSHTFSGLVTSLWNVIFIAVLQCAYLTWKDLLITITNMQIRRCWHH